MNSMLSLPNQPKLKRNGLIGLILLLSMTAPLSTDMYLAAFPTILKEFSTTTQLLNYTLVGFFIFFAIGMLLMGPLSDKYGRKPVLLSGLGLYLVSSLLCAVAFNIELLILFRITQALGAGAMVAVSTAIVKDSFSDIERPKIIALIQMLSVIAPTLAPIIGAVVIKYLNWQMTFVVLAAISIGAVFMALMFNETLDEEKKLKGSILDTFKSLGTIYKNIPFVTFLLATGCTGAIYMAFIAISSYIYMDWFSLSETQYSLFFAFNSIILMVGPSIYIKVKNLLTPKQIVLYSFGTIMLGGILTVLVGHTSPFVFVLTFLPITFSNSFLRAFSANVLLGQKEMNAGAASSVISFTNTAIGALGMMLGALPWSNYIVGLGTIAIVAMVISFILIAIYLKKNFSLNGF
ncbi:Bcr/CflA family efflux MFS transporter [Chryseobacterium sp.]|uniref:Bcr/CflA family efflux MFS transporter n=1 Tax=Chryseobacterium sp. TaxID=1871047 RepID=UPI00388F750E